MDPNVAVVVVMVVGTVEKPSVVVGSVEKPSVVVGSVEKIGEQRRSL